MATIKSENWDGVTAPAIPSGWTADTQLVTTTADNPASAPNSLAYPSTAFDITVQPHATWATPDGHGGNVVVRGTLRFQNNAGAGGEQDIMLFARSPVVAANATVGTATYYRALLTKGATPAGLLLQKRVAGANTTLGTVSAALADLTSYRLTLVCNGTTIQATCQRLTDSFWLNSSGVFVADATNSTVAIAVTDGAIAAASGYAGLCYYAGQTAGGDLALDDWLLATAPTISATPGTLVAGAGGHTVTLTGTDTNFQTASSTQFSLAGGTGASILSQSAASTTAATLVIDPGSAPGTLTLTDTSDANATTVLTVSSGRAAAAFYVSPAGSDANAGTSAAAPWQTIAHVNAQTFQPGDQILFQGGQSFSGTLLITHSGSAAQPLVVASYGTGPAIISAGTGTGIQIKDVDYVHVFNLTVIGSGVTVNGSTSSTTSTGSGVEVLSTQTQASVASWRESIYLDSLSVSGCYEGINCHSFGGATTGPYPVGFNDLRITNCTVHDTLHVGIHVWSNNAGSGSYFGIENGTGNVPYHKNVYVGSCSVSNVYGDSAITVLNTGNGILVGNTQTGTTERCFVTNCGQANGSWTNGGPGGDWCVACTDYTIQYCETSHMHDSTSSDGIGFDLDGGCTDCTIQYCYSHDNDGTGYIYGTYGGSRDNVRSTFRYNISQNDGRSIHCAAMRSFGGAGTTTGARIYNNTFYSGSPGTTPILLGDFVESDYAFYNNIIWCGSGVALFPAVGVSAGTFLNNLYWFGGGAFSLVYNNVTYSSLAAFQAVQEHAAGLLYGLFADPLLVAAGSGGTLLPSTPAAALGAYALRSTSPAIDAGLDLRTLFALDPGPIDFKGLPNRAGAGYDIGACEYGAAALLGAGSGVRALGLSGGIGG